jgi:hypothetical protein
MKSIIISIIFLFSLLFMMGTSLSLATVPIFSCSGYVVNQSGAGLGGIPVTLHIMGIDSNGTPCEIYNMTMKTNSDLPFIGEFQFDSIVLNQGVNATYGYADAVITAVDNQTLYGKSNNFSMSQPGTAIAEVIINTSIAPPMPTTRPIFPPVPSDSTPSPTPSPAPDGLFTVLAICAVTMIYLRKKTT